VSQFWGQLQIVFIQGNKGDERAVMPFRVSLIGAILMIVPVVIVLVPFVIKAVIMVTTIIAIVMFVSVLSEHGKWTH
jgi:hypothetical protein